MDRIDAKKKLQELTDQAYEVLRSAYGPEAELSIYVDDEYRNIDVRLWGKPDEKGDFINAPRRDLLCTSWTDTGWGMDMTIHNNDYYKKNGILLEVEE